MTVMFGPFEPFEPELGPPMPLCPVGPIGHNWILTIEEGQVQLDPDCERCRDEVLSPVGGEDIFMDIEVRGKLESHLETYGWETPEYDHWWKFQPESIKGLDHEQEKELDNGC